jgi:hypothetical protein
MKKSHFYKIKNKKRYKTANSFYYFVFTHDRNFLFTKNDLKQAMIRADKNPEDIPKINNNFLDTFSPLWYTIGIVIGGMIFSWLTYVLMSL